MENSLQHHGIKGQKWGRRRYQNKDGTLTPAGKKRYDNEYMQLKREKKVLTNKKRTAAKISKLDEMRKANEELRNEIEGPPKTKKSGKKETTVEKPKGIQDISTEELRARTERLRAEKDYISAQMELSRLQPEKVSAGRKFAEKFIKDAIVPAAVDIGKKTAESYLKKKLGLDDTTVNAMKKESERLKREADDWTNKKRADEAKEYFKNKNKTNSDSGDPDSKDNKDREPSQKQTDNEKKDSGNNSGSPKRDNDNSYEEFKTTGWDVVGEGNSRFTGWDSPQVRDAVWDGKRYVDELLGLPGGDTLGLPDPDRRKKR